MGCTEAGNPEPGRRRRKAIAWRLAAALLLLAGCTTRDGVLTAPQAGQGIIIVREKNNLAAEIYLDHRPTGKTTLDGRLEPAALGRHVVHLVLGKYRPVPESLVFDLGASGAELVSEMTAAPFGSLAIISDPGNAQVTLNGLDRGTTPDSGALDLDGLPSGSYSVSFDYGNYSARQTVLVAPGATATANAKLALQRFVLIEDFTNASCDGCPEVSRRVEDLVRSRGDYRILNDETHASFPSPNDPLYLAAKATHKFLEGYYNPPFLPAVYCNGAKIEFGQNYTLVDSLLSGAITTSLAAPGLANIVITPGDPGHGWVRVAAVGAPIEGTVLRLDVLQKETVFASPPGTNKQTVFHNAIRASLWDGHGVPVSLGRGEFNAFEYDFELSAYPAASLFLVAYLQRDSDKSVLQANTSPLTIGNAAVCAPFPKERSP